MLKFMLASRSKPEHTKERYYFEWGIIHVALMLTTPTVMSTFRRYAQHFVPDGLDGDKLLFPLSEMAWENMADHWLETWDDLVLPFKADDYPNRMQPHNFGDSNFDLQLMTGEELYAEDGYYSGGIKLVHFLHRRRRCEPRRVQGEVPRTRRRAGRTPAADCCASTCRTPRRSGDPAYFKGTLFELGGVNTYSGVEELWFDDVDAVYAFCSDAGTAGQAARELRGLRRRRHLLDGHHRARRVRLRDARPRQPAAGGPGRRAPSRPSSTRRATRAGGCPAGRSGRARRPSRDAPGPRPDRAARRRRRVRRTFRGGTRRRVRRGAPGLRGPADRRDRDDAGHRPVPAGSLHLSDAQVGLLTSAFALAVALRRHPDGPRVVAVGRQDAVRRRRPSSLPAASCSPWRTRTSGCSSAGSSRAWAPAPASRSARR